jgi:putative glutamine amidotransferase
MFPTAGMSAIIGITSGTERRSDDAQITFLPNAYIEAILESGGVPVLIPALLSDETWKTVYRHVDGVLFSGGGDIDVGLFAGTAHPAVHSVDPSRDALELSLVRAMAEDRKPFLGICRGCQVMNVGLGGTLYTHLPDQLPGALEHDQLDGGYGSLSHEVQIEPGSILSEIMPDIEIRVNSHHHQGIWEVGAGLRVAARAPDGLVEALELADHPFGLAVQWHPERLPDQPHAARLFSRFVQAAAEYRERAVPGCSK